MNPQQPTSQPPYQSVQNPLAAMRENEVVLCEIKRHPIGLFGVYVMAGLVVLAIVAVAMFGVPMLPSGHNNLKLWSSVIAALLVVLTIIYAYVATRIYNANRWVVTSDSITQISQVGLFDTQSSQLPLTNLEDVTADQYGVLPHMFGFGTLNAQTAGEHSKFSFPFCPNPNKYAQIILAAREEMEAGRAEGPLGNPPQA